MANNSQLTNSDYKTIYEKFKAFYVQQIDRISPPFNFNILDAQCGTIKENSHTNILIKLLEYKDQYGYYVFLEDFIKQLTRFDVSIDPQKPIKFKTEYFDAISVEALAKESDNKQPKKKKQGRIDGLIYQENTFAIIFENKVNEAANQDVQLLRYIKSVIGEGNKKVKLVEVDKVFVVFLTKDGVEPPDPQSIEFMRNEQVGILYKPEPNEKSESISGSRYFACSYRYDILPWLEKSVQPLVYQKELILNTGLIQYIDFLKGMLGERDEDNEIRKSCREEFDKLVEIILYGKDLEGQNTELYDLYKFLQNLYKDIKRGTDANKKKKTDCINLLQSLVYEKAEEPMAEFMKVTKDYFTSGPDPLIMEKNYRMSAVLTFYYIFIRDKNWPKGVKIGWYPARLLNGQPNASLFYEDPSKCDDPQNGELTKLGFHYIEKGKAWRKEYSSVLPHIDVKPFDGENLKKLYDESGIRQIIESIKTNNKA